MGAAHKRIRVPLEARRRTRQVRLREFFDDLDDVPDKGDAPVAISSESLKGYAELVLELGGDPDFFLSSSRIQPSSLSGVPTHISFRAVTSLLEHTAHTLKCPDLGMRLAERQYGTLNMKPLDELIGSAPTFGKATHRSIVHMSAYSSAIRQTLEFDDSRQQFALRFDFRVDNLPPTPQLSERMLLLAHHSTVTLTGGAARSREVWFSHLRISSPKAYRKRFQAPVKFGQAFDGIFFTEADLRQPLLALEGASPVEAIDFALGENLSPVEELLILSKDYLRDRLPAGKVERDELAAYLGISSRTLHRRLQAAGCTFESLRDDVRRTLALRFLGRIDLSFSEVAGKLGYSEQAVLSRACQRWFSATPLSIREALISKDLHIAPK